MKLKNLTHMLTLLIMMVSTNSCMRERTDNAYRAACLFDGHAVPVDKDRAFLLY